MSEVPGVGPWRRRLRRHGCGCGCLVVACILLAIVWRARESALDYAVPKGVCLSNISQLSKAMRLYTLDWNGYIYPASGDAFSDRLLPGRSGPAQLKSAMKTYIPNWEIWYCPSDPFAKRDFSCDPQWSGSFTYRPAQFGYVAVPHVADRDRGIRALRRKLARDYGADQMRVDHEQMSYRFVPGLPGEPRPVRVDGAYRIQWKGWGAYGYWDINPTKAEVFEEDLPFHEQKPGQRFGTKVYGKTFGFRDGHAEFRTYLAHGLNNYGGKPKGTARPRQK